MPQIGARLHRSVFRGSLPELGVRTAGFESLLFTWWGLLHRSLSKGLGLLVCVMRGLKQMVSRPLYSLHGSSSAPGLLQRPRFVLGRGFSMEAVSLSPAEGQRTGWCCHLFPRPPLPGGRVRVPGEEWSMGQVALDPSVFPLQEIAVSALRLPLCSLQLSSIPTSSGSQRPYSGMRVAWPWSSAGLAPALVTFIQCRLQVQETLAASRMVGSFLLQAWAGVGHKKVFPAPCGLPGLE